MLNRLFADPQSMTKKEKTKTTRNTYKTGRAILQIDGGRSRSWNGVQFLFNPVDRHLYIEYPPAPGKDDPKIVRKIYGAHPGPMCPTSLCFEGFVEMKDGSFQRAEFEFIPG